MKKLILTAFVILFSNVFSAIIYADDNNDVGLILLGDTGAANANKDKVAQAVQIFCQINKCSYVLLLGDNFYDVGVSDVNDEQFQSKFEQPYRLIPYKFYPVLGNHDYSGNWQAQIQYSSEKWHMLDRYYTIDAANASIFAIDTNIYTRGDQQEIAKQNQWLQSSLKHSSSKWRIVYGHHPIYSNGIHGNTEELIQLLNPILCSHEVDFYISGHDHNKELIEYKKMKYVISGTGSSVRPIIAGFNSKFSASTLGFAYLLLEEDKATLKFVDSDAQVEFEQQYSKT